MAIVNRIKPCLWFDDQAEQAANFYAGIFPNSRIGAVARYTEVGREHHGKAPGSAMSVEFVLDGLAFIALNGGPVFRFTEAISLSVECADQQEVDHYWQHLGEGGDPAAQRCGWLKDRYGLSWQVVPAILPSLLRDKDPARAARATQAMLQMGKLDIAALQKAHAG